MKKILLFLILTFWVSNVMALEYTDYSEFSEFSEEVIKEDDLTDVKVERRYKYYKLNEVMGPYLEKSNEEYPCLDKDDYIYTDYSAVSNDRPEDKEGRIIFEDKGYKYKKVKDINYITITAWMGYIDLENVKVWYKGEELNYEAEFSDRADGFNLQIEGMVTLKLPYDVDIRYVEVSLDIKGADDRTQYVFRTGNDSDSHIWTQDLYEYSGEKSNTWIGSSAVSTMYAWEEFYSLEKLDTSRVLKLLGETTLYRYKDILYHTYKLEREYYPDYVTGPVDDYIYKDETLYKDYYAKRVRSIIPEKEMDKLVIEDSKDNMPVTPIKQANDISILSSDDINDNSLKSREIKRPEKTTYYQIETPQIESDIETNKWGLLYILFPFLLILVILILVLSKLYKNKKACDTL